MRIIKIESTDGKHDMMSGSLLFIPDGFAVIPDTITIPDAFPFVDIEVVDGVVTSMTANQTAYDAAQAAAQAEQDEQPTLEQQVATLTEQLAVTQAALDDLILN